MKKLILCAAGIILFLGAKPNFTSNKKAIEKLEVSKRIDSLERGLSQLKPKMENLMLKIKR